MNPWRPLSAKHIISYGIILLLSFSAARARAQQPMPWGRGHTPLAKAPMTAIPAGFIRNLGQVKAREGGRANNVYFVFSSPNTATDVYITNQGISYVYKKLLDKKTRSVRARIDGKPNKGDSSVTYHYSVERIDASLIHGRLDTSTAEVIYAREHSALFNYYDGQSEIKGQRLIQKIIFKNVYPGIDWVLQANEKGDSSALKYDFIIHEGGDPKAIKISYSGNVALNPNEDHGVTAKGNFGFVKEGHPLILAAGPDLHAGTRNWPADYRIENNTLTYTAPAWPTSYPYTIDPDLYWGTFLHSTLPFDGVHFSSEYASDVTTDPANNIFVVMNCTGSVAFPTENPGGGAYYNDVYDNVNGATIYMKFSPAGVLLWSTYFSSGAGSTPENGYNTAHIVADGNGNLFGAAPFTGNLPLRNNGGFFVGAPPPNGPGNTNYLVRFDNNGVLNWSTQWSYFDNIITDVTVDADNSFYITGYSTRNALPQKDPGNGGYFTNSPGGIYNAFISKFDNQCNLVWSTNIQNGGDQGTTRIAVDKNKNVYMLVESAGSGDYPLVNAGGFFQNTGISWLAKFDAGYHMVWSTYMINFSRDVTTDPAGNVYVVGQTQAPPYNYVDPGNGAYMDPTRAGIGGEIMRFDANTNLTWATTYYNAAVSFQYVVFETYRNLLHVYGTMDGPAYNVPTQNDACSGGYYHPGTQVGTATDPILLIFSQTGQRLYATFNAFPYAYYDVSAFTVDNKGDQIYVFGQIQESGPLITFPALKDPGGGAFYQAGVDNYQNNASFLMKLTPSLLNVTTSVQPPAGCNCSGSVTVTPFCGSGNYQYQWSRGDVTPTIANVCPGNYTVKVTDMSTMSDTLLKVSLPNPPANLNSAVLNATPDHCSKNDGTIQISGMTGGPAPYTFALGAGPFTGTPSFSNLPDGTYQVTVRDNDGCQLVNSVVITAAAGPDAINTTINPTACNQDNGTILVAGVDGGTTPYTFALDNGSATAVDDFAGLAAKSYQLTVYDAAGCTASISVTVPMAQGPSGVQTEIADTHCDQSIGGILVDDVTGGQSPYTYSLDDRSFQSVNSFSGLPAGNGTMYLQDANGCSYSTPFSISNVPGPQKINFTQKDALCGATSGSLQILSVTGGAPPYVYSTGGSAYSGQTLLQGLLPGQNLFSVEDAYGCILVDSTVIRQTPKLQIAVSPGDTLVCAADKVGFRGAVIGTNDGVEFTWNNGSNTSPTYEGSFFTDTMVIVQAVDANGCTATETISIKVHYCDSILSKCVVFPNAFTPNADGSNDRFGPHIASCDVRNYELSIFDRWGQMVFHAKDPMSRWDGRLNGNPPIDGTYIYTCTWADDLGIVRHLKGFVVLIR
jgi:gliding motility-associated-like protein